MAKDPWDGGGLDLKEGFIDGSFAGAKKASMLAKPSGERETKSMAIADSAGLSRAVRVDSASPHGITLVETTIDQSFLNEPPLRLVGDKAYDNDGLDAGLRDRGIEAIGPHRENRNVQTQDGRPCGDPELAGKGGPAGGGGPLPLRPPSRSVPPRSVRA